MRSDGVKALESQNHALLCPKASSRGDSPAGGGLARISARFRHHPRLCLPKTGAIARASRAPQYRSNPWARIKYKSRFAASIRSGASHKIHNCSHVFCHDVMQTSRAQLGFNIVHFGPLTTANVIDSTTFSATRKEVPGVTFTTNPSQTAAADAPKRSRLLSFIQRAARRPARLAHTTTSLSSNQTKNDAGSCAVPTDSRPDDLLVIHQKDDEAKKDSATDDGSAGRGMLQAY